MGFETMTVEQFLDLNRSIEGKIVEGRPVLGVCAAMFRPKGSNGPSDPGGWTFDVLTDRGQYSFSLAGDDVKQSEIVGLVRVRDFEDEDVERCDFDPGNLSGWKVLDVLPPAG